MLGGQSTKRSKPIESLILTIRGHRVMIDADLADLYGVETRTLNQAVKRNADRFPKDFMFRLSAGEKSEVITNCDHLRRLKFAKSLPFAFTEHGAIMAATVLNSPQAVSMASLWCGCSSRCVSISRPTRQYSNDWPKLTGCCFSMTQRYWTSTRNCCRSCSPPRTHPSTESASSRRGKRETDRSIFLRLSLRGIPPLLVQTPHLKFQEE